MLVILIYSFCSITVRCYFKKGFSRRSFAFYLTLIPLEQAELKIFDAAFAVIRLRTIIILPGLARYFLHRLLWKLLFFIRPPWCRLWVVARLLKLLGLPLWPHPEEGVGDSNNHNMGTHKSSLGSQLLCAHF